MDREGEEPAARKMVGGGFGHLPAIPEVQAASLQQQLVHFSQHRAPAQCHVNLVIAATGHAWMVGENSGASQTLMRWVLSCRYVAAPIPIPLDLLHTWTSTASTDSPIYSQTDPKRDVERKELIWD